MMVVYGDVPSARLLRVSVREVFYKVQDASEEVVVCWVRWYPAKDAAEEGEVDPNTACAIYRYFFGGSS